MQDDNDHLYDEMTRRNRKERKDAKHAECFARLVLAGKTDRHGRNLLAHAERTTSRIAMQWEKTIAWLAAALGADGVRRQHPDRDRFRARRRPARDGRATSRSSVAGTWTAR